MYQNFDELLIIDDDCCHNIVCALALKKIFRPSNVNLICFTNSEEGLAYMMQSAKGAPKKTLLFLDINMPRMNGWEVLSRLEQLPRAVRKSLHVYILTASPNARDEAKALRSSLVKQYLEKPLSEHLHSIFEQRAVQLSAA
jgi:CheY-like chemotaxis protein